MVPLMFVWMAVIAQGDLAARQLATMLDDDLRLQFLKPEKKIELISPLIGGSTFDSDTRDRLRYHRLLAYISLNDFDRARPDSDYLLAKFPTKAMYLLPHIKIAIGQKDFDEARKFIDIVIKAEPKNDSAWSAKAQLALIMERPDEAMECADKSLAIDKTNEEALAVRIWAFAIQKKWRECITASESLSRRNTMAAYKFVDYYYIRGVAYAQLGDYERALENYRLALCDDPESERVVGGTWETLRKLGRHRLALSFMEDQLKRKPKHLPYKESLYRSHIALSQFREALPIAEELLKVNEESVVLQFHVAYAQFHLGNWEKADQFCKACLVLDPMHTPALVMCATLRAASPIEKMRDGKQALSIVDFLEKADQTDPIEIVFLRSLALAETKEYIAATKLVDGILETLPKNAPGRNRFTLLRTLLQESRPYRLTVSNAALLREAAKP